MADAKGEIRACGTLNSKVINAGTLPSRTAALVPQKINDHPLSLLRYPLTEIQSRWRRKRWKADLAAIVFMGMLSLASVYSQLSIHYSLAFSNALAAALDRLLLNPASSVENLFYFGFLTERLSHKTGRWATPPLIGLMYTVHEMSNPEYWYSGLSFAMVFVGITITSAVYLWR